MNFNPVKIHNLKKQINITMGRKSIQKPLNIANAAENLQILANCVQPKIIKL